MPGNKPPKNHDAKYAALFVLVACALGLGACGKSDSQKQTTFTFTHPQGAAGSAAGPQQASALKSQCFSKMADTSNQRVSDDPATPLVKICESTGDPKAPYKIYSKSRSFTFSKQGNQSGPPTIGIAMTIGLDIEATGGSAPMQMNQNHLSDLQQQIQNACNTNMVAIWKKSGIDLTITYQSGRGGDQFLALNSSLASDGSDQNPNSSTDEVLSFDFWKDTPAKFYPANAKKCFDLNPPTQGGPRDTGAAQRAACVADLNQPFCLALNKVVGIWLGVEDKTDINCHPNDAVVIDPKAQAQSFVIYRTTPDSAGQTAPLNFTPVDPTSPATTASTDPNDHKAAMAAFEQESHAIMASLIAVQQAGTGSGTPTRSPLNPNAPHARPKASRADQNPTDSAAAKGDSYYLKYWSKYAVLDPDVNQIFTCATTAPAATGTTQQQASGTTNTSAPSATIQAGAPAGDAAGTTANAGTSNTDN